MITYKKGNLLEQPDIDVIIHQANLFHTFGAGIAKQIKEKFPEAYAADCKTVHGDKSRLGNYSYAFSNDKLILNLYSQFGLSSSNRVTSYDAMVTGLTKIKLDIECNVFDLQDNFKIGMPHKIGCGLANGNWEIVNSILKSIFEDSELDVNIYEFCP